MNLAIAKRNVTAFQVTAEDFSLSYLRDNHVNIGINEGLEILIFNEVLYYLDHVSILKKFSKLMNKTGIVIISNWFTKRVPMSMKMMTEIFNDAGMVYIQIDEIIIQGLDSHQKPLAARIGMFAVRPSNESTQMIG